jgi:hypothetical protein
MKSTYFNSWLDEIWQFIFPCFSPKKNKSVSGQGLAMRKGGLGSITEEQEETGHRCHRKMVKKHGEK